MNMNPWELKTINDMLEYCQDVVRRYNVEFSTKEKEALASEVIGFMASDHFNEWQKGYPLVDDIEYVATNLSWSNVEDVDESWEKLIGYIDELAQQIGSHPKE